MKVIKVMAVMMVAVIAGCSLKDAFSGHQDVVASAAGQELTVEHLASLLAPIKQVPLRREIFERIADSWIDDQLLAHAVAGGDSLMDSATVEAANWPIIVQTIVNNYHDSAMGALKPTPQQIDSVFNGADYRYVSHILIMCRQDTTDAVKAAKRRIAEGYLAQLRRGANFAQLARRVSEDPGSKAQGGNLGLVPRGVMVKPFEDAAFALQPGEISPVVQTTFGYHILWRPVLAAVRDSFTLKLADLLSQRADSVFLDSLTNRSGLTIKGGAAQAVRAIAQNLRRSKSRWRNIATWRGGSLDEGRFATWLAAYGQQTRAAAADPSVPDSSLREFVKTIARSEMLVRAAQAAHIGLSREQKDSVRQAYREELAALVTGLGVSADSLAADSSARGAAAPLVAARHVDAYFTAVTSNLGSRPFLEVPTFLGDHLRGRSDWRLNAAGVDRAVERARLLRGPETPREGQLNRVPGAIQRAPGGPPIGGTNPPVHREVR